MAELPRQSDGRGWLAGAQAPGAIPAALSGSAATSIALGHVRLGLALAVVAFLLDLVGREARDG